MPIESTSGERHRHRLIRRVLCVRGTVDMRLECEPSFDYGRAQHTLELGDRGALFKSSGLSLSLSTPVPLEQVGMGVRAAVHPERGRERRVRARAGVQGRLDRPHRPARRGDRGVLGDRRVLAPLGRAIAVPGPLARDGRALGADAQAADLPADGRHRRRPHDEPARGDRRPAQLGLPLHVDPRRGLLAVRAPAARLHRGGRRVHELARATDARARAPSRRDRPAADHVRDRRARAPAGVRADALQRLPATRGR